MSVYYSYYIGYLYDGKVYPWGPYIRIGKLRPVFERSKSSLGKSLNLLQAEEISLALLDDFPNVPLDNIRWATFNSLDYVDDNFIKSGYFPIRDVQRYLTELNDYESDFFDAREIFDQPMSSVEFSARMLNQSRFSARDEDIDVRDYMYFAYPDYFSKQWEMNILRRCESTLFSFAQDGIPAKAEPCIILVIS